MGVKDEDDFLLNRAERIGNAVISAYTDWHSYFPSFPAEFYEDNPLMKDYEGNVLLASEVSDYLLQKVPLEEREDVLRKVRYLDKIVEAASRVI